MNKIGKFGEDVACLFLMKHGFKVIERNYAKKWGELDIVASKEGKVYFVEVKSVSCEIRDSKQKNVTHVTSYRPEENMTKTKIGKFLRIIQTYLIDRGLKNKEWQMSLIAIRLDVSKKKARVRFIENLIVT